MGAGKTTVGRDVARLTERPFVDLDAELERRHGLEIPLMFAERGEPWFRNEEAEFAIVVRPELQGLGLGRLLLEKLLRYSRAHGTQRLVGWVLRDNHAMLALALALGFLIDEAGSDVETLRVVRQPL